MVLKHVVTNHVLGTTPVCKLPKFRRLHMHRCWPFLDAVLKN